MSNGDAISTNAIWFKFKVTDFSLALVFLVYFDLFSFLVIFLGITSSSWLAQVAKSVKRHTFSRNDQKKNISVLALFFPFFLCVILSREYTQSKCAQQDWGTFGHIDRYTITRSLDALMLSIYLTLLFFSFQLLWFVIELLIASAIHQRLIQM